MQLFHNRKLYLRYCIKYIAWRHHPWNHARYAIIRWSILYIQRKKHAFTLPRPLNPNFYLSLEAQGCNLLSAILFTGKKDGNAWFWTWFWTEVCCFLYLQTFGHVYFHTFELIWTNVRQYKSELFRISTRLSFVLLCIVYGVKIMYSWLSMVPKFLHVSS